MHLVHIPHLINDAATLIHIIQPCLDCGPPTSGEEDRFYSWKGRKILCCHKARDILDCNNASSQLSAVGMATSQFLVTILGTTSICQCADRTIFAKHAAAQKASIAFVFIYIFLFAST